MPHRICNAGRIVGAIREKYRLVVFGTLMCIQDVKNETQGPAKFVNCFPPFNASSATISFLRPAEMPIAKKCL
jgi:hypothetical protein